MGRCVHIAQWARSPPETLMYKQSFAQTAQLAGMQASLGTINVLLLKMATECKTICLFFVLQVRFMFWTRPILGHLVVIVTLDLSANQVQHSAYHAALTTFPMQQDQRVVSNVLMDTFHWWVKRNVSGVEQESLPLWVFVALVCQERTQMKLVPLNVSRVLWADLQVMIIPLPAAIALWDRLGISQVQPIACNARMENSRIKRVKPAASLAR